MSVYLCKSLQQKTPKELGVFGVKKEKTFTLSQALGKNSPCQNNFIQVCPCRLETRASDVPLDHEADVNNTYRNLNSKSHTRHTDHCHQSRIHQGGYGPIGSKCEYTIDKK